MFSIYLVILFVSFYAGFRVAMVSQIDDDSYTVPAAQVSRAASAGLALALAMTVAFILDGGSFFVSVN